MHVAICLFTSLNKQGIIIHEVDTEVNTNRKRRSLPNQVGNERTINYILIFKLCIHITYNHKNNFIFMFCQKINGDKGKAPIQPPSKDKTKKAHLANSFSMFISL